MTLLAISPDFASHYQPIAVVARAVLDRGERVVVATGPTMRPEVEADGFEWCDLRLGAGSNTGIVERSPSIDRFLAATRRGPIATLSLQAHDRAHDLLWRPEAVTRRIAELCDVIDPDQVLVDHVSFGSTLAMYATGRPFVSLVPGHPSQLPVGDQRYGVPPHWPAALAPSVAELAELNELVDRVAHTFTDRWNTALAEVAPTATPVADAFRVHGQRVLYNSPVALRDPYSQPVRTFDHRFLGPLVRDEVRPPAFDSWARRDGTPLVFVALGTFLSHRDDVLVRIAAALRQLGVRAAIATGPTQPAALGSVPDDWIVTPELPQVALLADADLVIHHGGNNSVQESLVAGARQLVLPFSTDQFANAHDLERTGLASVAAPNTASAHDVMELIGESLAGDSPAPIRRRDPGALADAITEPAPTPA